MVKALVKISDEVNRVLNIVKAKRGLKDKGEAIEFVVKQYEKLLLDPRFRAERVKRVRRPVRKN